MPRELLKCIQQPSVRLVVVVNSGVRLYLPVADFDLEPCSASTRMTAIAGVYEHRSQRSHLSALCNDDVTGRSFASNSRVLDFVNDVHAIDDFAEDHVLVVQKGRLDRGDKELGAIAVFAGVGHAEQARGVVRQVEVFVGERLCAVDGGTAGAVAVEKISALYHEVLDDPMEFGPLVALRSPLSILGVARAELTKVLGGPGGDLCEKLHLHASQGLS